MRYIFLLHLILRQTPSLSRGSKLSTEEMLKKADERIHGRRQQFKRGLLVDLVQEYKADVQVWENMLAREKARDEANER